MGSVSHLGYFGERAGRKANPFPRRVLIGAMALLAFSAAAIVFGQVTGIGTVRQNPGAPVAMRDRSGRRASRACYGEHGPGSSCLRPERQRRQRRSAVLQQGWPWRSRRQQ